MSISIHSKYGHEEISPCHVGSVVQHYRGLGSDQGEHSVDEEHAGRR